MKKMIIGFLALASISSAFATTTHTCTSANYTVSIADIEEFPFANYGINGKMNEGADVEVDGLYVSDRVIAAALSVDGQKKKFEVSVSRTASGKFSGKIFTGKVSQDAKCTRL